MKKNELNDLKYDIESMEIQHPLRHMRSHQSSNSDIVEQLQKIRLNAVSSNVQELMHTRKEILQKVWEDIDENWRNREDFIHLHFRDSAHENYEPISNETIRVFEIRWLDLRTKGLIAQRENLLTRLKKTSDLSLKKDHDDFLVYMIEEMQIYRTLTLYIIEHIIKWCDKQPEEKVYYWKPVESKKKRKFFLEEEKIDYMFKMASDFLMIVANNPTLTQVLKELRITVSPLALPKYPSIYQDFEKSSKFSTSDFFSSMTSYSKSTSKRSSKEERPVSEEIRKKRSQLDIRLPSPNPNYIGSVQSSPRIPQKQEKSFFLTETGADNDFGLEFEPMSNEMPPVDISSLQQYIDLPPLMVEQKYVDRSKRHKRYSEPLLSVRHEDLLREATMNNFSEYQIPMSIVVDPNAGYRSKVNLASTNQVLSKGASRRANSHFSPNLHLNSTKKRRKMKHEKKKQKNTIEFLPPQHGKELERVCKAQKHLLTYYKMMNNQPQNFYM